MNNNALLRMKVNHRLNDVFTRIIQDIPNTELKTSKNALAVTQKNGLMTYEEFYEIVYRSVLEYVPRDGENSMLMVIKMLPRVTKNIQRIKINDEIIRKQNEILQKYFFKSAPDNIKKKLKKLETSINKLIKNNEVDLIEACLNNFESRMRDGLLTDLKELSNLLDKRN